MPSETTSNYPQRYLPAYETMQPIGYWPRSRQREISPNMNINDKNVQLKEAAKFGRYSEIESLISQGIKANGEGLTEGMPLQVASINGHINVVKLLLKNGADIEGRNKMGYPLQFAAENGHLEIVQYLVENKANIHGFNNEEMPLKDAIKNKHKRIVEYLIEKGAVSTREVLKKMKDNGWEDLVEQYEDRSIGSNLDLSKS